MLSTAQVGRTALSVTRLGFGGAPIGGLFAPISDDQAQATIQAALASGLRFFDTAPLYGCGSSERRFGLGLASVPRESLVLQTKVGRTLLAGEAASGAEWAGKIKFAYSRDAILRGLEASLRRLGVNRVDIVLIHDPDDYQRQALDEAFPTLAELRAQGVVRAIGAGMNVWQPLREFAQHADPDCFLLAGRYTLLEQGALEFMDLCAAKTISVFLGGVFNSGILAGGPRDGATYNYAAAPPEIVARARQLQAVCDRHTVTLKAAALHFAAAHPAVTALILGMVTPEEVMENVRNWHTPLPAALWSELRAEGLIRAEAPLPGPSSQEAG
jgi:D-threo-aldose 1-dehydrogenase